ncbi:lipid-A-disaccharide synthase-related protein [Acidobacteriota bacterium]
MHLCFFSNGYGEDRSAALIARELRTLRPWIKISAAPLITQGEEYARRDIPVITKGVVPPSGGFPLLSAGAFLSDFTYNRQYLNYYRDLKPFRKEIDGGMVVGDTFLLVLVRLAVGKDLVHLSLSKSEHKNSHFWFEESIFRRIPSTVLTRDDLTCRTLREKKINVCYLGNPIMDDLSPKGIDLGRKRIIGLLPGSKQDSYENFKKLLQVVDLVKEEVSFICALSGGLETGLMVDAALKEGWRRDEALLRKGRRTMQILKNAFDDIIARSDVLVSLAGTATEQAVGLGKPVVSFEGSGTQTNNKRMKDQERLLGGAVKYITDFPNGVADEISRLLSDPEERARRGEIGRSRMGSAGASKRIAEFLADSFHIPSEP